MERTEDEEPIWSNPETDSINLCEPSVAPESEPCDLPSTIDPSHIIHLIRQMLPVSGTSSDRQPSYQAIDGKLLGEIDGPKPVQNPTSGEEEGLEERTCTPVVLDNSTPIQVDEFKTDGTSREDAKEEQAATNTKGLEECMKLPEQNGGCKLGYNTLSFQASERLSANSLQRVRASSNRDGEVGRLDGGIQKEGVQGNSQNEAVQETGGDEDPREESGCVLWDLAATQTHAEFLVENHILEVLLAILGVPQTDRMREICLGILGNLACHAGPEKAMVAAEGLVPTIVQQLFVEDSPSLSEACRLLSAGLHSDVASTWAVALKAEEILERIMWIAANTMNAQLLEKSTELLLAMVDSRRDAASNLLPSLLRIGLPELLTDLLACEVAAISEGTSSCGDVVLDIILQIAETLSLPDDFASQLAANQKLFSLACQVIRLSARDEIGPSGITATVLIANLLTEEAGLIHEVSHDAILVGRLLALVPAAGDDPGARNALWSILGRICRCLVATRFEPPYCSMSSMIVVLADGCSLLLDDLVDHLEDDVEEDKDRALAGYDATASTSRGLQAKLATVGNMSHIMEEWAARQVQNASHDRQLMHSLQSGCSSLRKHIAANETAPGSVEREFCSLSKHGPSENGGSLTGTQEVNPSFLSS